ncbi:hypothetical protein GCM10007385_12230 [Tateyamaria omphalii]|uniref:hypothetical protein n=1 Tax=Tateyamaria omphalii TaxID=299262 RepID=UPI001671A117|nr:hypothetical protein [Tateyamaria omphalii]GGX46254.1 hypothetical protein GCM10007385_12230 [Tateyamaria omphalii]
MADAPIYIHAGAHRTGTSSFQMCLHENWRALDQEGWTSAYPGRDGNPSGELALRLPSGYRVDPAAAAAKATLGLDAYRDGRPVVLSEENIPGRMFHFLQGQFYPFAEMRCTALRAAWSGPIAHVLLVVRPYDQLFESAYRKRAEDNEMSDFRDASEHYMNMDRGWPELVQLMQEILQPDALTVVPYEVRGTNLDLLRRLVPGLSTDALIEPQGKVNQSATDAALDALQVRYRRGETLSRKEWQAVIREHSAAKQKTGFASFGEEEKAELSARYASDLKQIEWMTNVSFA